MSYFELYEHKKSDKIKWIIAFVLIVILLAGMIGAWAVLLTDKDESEPGETPAEELLATSGAIIGDSAGNGIALMSSKIAATDYETYGVSTLAESAYSLTAIIMPENATFPEVDWSVSFVDPLSSWASGKTVTDYVKVTPADDGAATATVECLQAFGELIAVTVSGRKYPSIKATCSMDYVKRVADHTTYSSPATIAFTGSGSTYTPVLSVSSEAVGTIMPSVEITRMIFRVGDFASTDTTLHEVDNSIAKYYVYGSKYADIDVFLSGKNVAASSLVYTSPFDMFANVDRETDDFNAASSFWTGKTYTTVSSLAEANTLIENAYNEWFVDYALSEGSNFKVLISCNALHNGTVCETFTLSVDVNVDVTSLIVDLTGLSLSDESITV